MTENWLNDEGITAKIAALEENYKVVTEKVAQAAIKSGRRPEEITLLAATKTVPVPVINRAIELGITCIGENKVQEPVSYTHLDVYKRQAFLQKVEILKLQI